MQLDRNQNSDGTGKYALVKLRNVKISRIGEEDVKRALETLRLYDCLDYGDTPNTDFFVIRIKDKYAGPALRAYAQAAIDDDHEYAAEMFELAVAAENHPSKRMPD